MVETGVAIVLARRELVGLLTRAIIETADPASPFPDAMLSLSGSLEPVATEMTALDLEDAYRDRLRDTRRIDAAAGRTLEGPHRSDLEVVHRPKAMAAGLCSTGEQKSLLVGLLLAHARLVAGMTGHAPVLLLDEIAAHLDEHRRAALFDRVEALDCQAFMTGTDRALFSALGNRAQYIRVDGGTAREE
jgi:DNA replication and repair protein RecF